MPRRSPRRSRLTRIGREVFWVGAGQGLGALGSLIGVRLLTGALDPARYGELALGVTAASFVQMSVLQPLYEASLRFFSVAVESGQLAAFLAAVRRLTLFVTRALVIGSVGLLLVMMVAGGRQWLGLAALSALFSLLSGAAVTMSGIQNAARQRATVAWHDSSSQWLRFGLAVILIGWLGPRSDVAMLGYALACSIVLMSQTWFLSRNPHIAAARHADPSAAAVSLWDRQLREYAWPIATWGIFVGLYLMSGRWSLQLLQSRTTVGLYSVIYQLGYYPVVMMNMLMMVVVQPIMFSRAGAGADPMRTARGHQLGLVLMGVTLLATVAAAAIAGLWHEFIFAMFVAPDYRHVSYLLAPMVLGSGFFCCAQVASMVGMINPDTTRLIRPKVGASVIGTILNFAGAWRFGLDGVVYAGVLYGLLYLWWVAKVLRILPWSAKAVPAAVDGEVTP